MKYAKSWFVGTVVGLLLGGMLVLGSTTVQASSLWSAGTSMFTDQKARAVGDLVTLIIIERSQASQEASTSSQQESELSLGPGTGLLHTIPLIGAGGGDQSSVRGSTSRGGSIQAQMTTRVIDILPNGNMVIEGRQTIVINGEDQEIVVSGIVRPRDIAPDNTVLSTYVADAHIAFKGNGPLAEKHTPGVLTRLFNWLF